MGTFRKVLYEVETANRMLPLVRAIAADIVGEFRRLRTAGREHRDIEARDTTIGGESTRLQTLKARIDACSQRVEGYLLELEELGLEIRDLESGLIDFPTLIQGEPAYLCWKLGEEEVLWWHAAGQGFAERRPIPQPARAEPARLLE